MPFNKEPVRLPKQTKEAKVNRLLPNRPSECIPNINETSPPKHSVDSLEEVMADKKDNAIYTASHPNELLLSRVDIPLPTLTSPLTQPREFKEVQRTKKAHIIHTTKTWEAKYTADCIFHTCTLKCGRPPGENLKS